MGAGVFSRSTRVLACGHCGGPVDAPGGGGAINCSYCGRTSHVERRNEQAYVRAEAAASGSESERIANLRSQRAQGEALPPALDGLLGAPGFLDPGQDVDAKEMWLSVRASLSEGSASFVHQERLFHLTTLLVPRLSDREQRALLETAIELLDDGGYQHVLSCMMSRLAARSGDIDSAKEWLSLCEPRPRSLRLDTAYRYAQATTATAEGDPMRVLSLLGESPGDLPIAAQDERGCSLLRAHALESSGQQATAENQLRQLRDEVGWESVAASLRLREPLKLCPMSASVLSEEHRRERMDGLEREIGMNAFTSRAAVVAVGASLSVLAGLGMVFMIAFDSDRPHPEWVRRICPSCSSDFEVLLVWAALFAAVSFGGAGLFLAMSTPAARKKQRELRQELHALEREG